MSQVRIWEAQAGIRTLEAEGRHIRATGASDLERLLAQTPGEGTEASHIISFFAGPLLLGHEDSSEEFGFWLSSARTRLEEKLADLALAAKGSKKDVSAVLDAAQELRPYDERLLKARVQGLVSSGRVHDATLCVRRFEQILREDLAAPISSDLNAWLASVFGPKSATAAADPALEAGPTRWPLPKVVLIPPTNTSGGALSILASALVAEVNLALCVLRTFAMIAPYTARRLTEEIAEAQAAALGADYVVRTAVMQDRSMSFVLIRLSTRAILTADSVPLKDSTVAAKDLAQSIAAAISDEIANNELFEHMATGNTSAYVHYLMGCERLRHDLPAIRKARRSFQAALDEYPRFAPAKAMLARTLSMEWLVLRRDNDELLKAALDTAGEAVAIDPLGAAGRWELSMALLYLNRLDESLDQVSAARQRAPHMADLLSDEADVHVHLGMGDAALEKINQALELNPIAPDEYHWVKGSALFIGKDYAGALNSLLTMKDTRQVSRLIAVNAALLGREEIAASHRELWLEQYPDFHMADWAKSMPMKDADVQARMLEGMAKAGFR